MKAIVQDRYVHLMTGRPMLMRVIGLGLRGPKVRVCGMDLAGVVFGVADGSFAEYAVARVGRCRCCGAR